MRKVVNIDGRTTSEKEETKDIELFPGLDEKNVFKFPGMGNEAPGQISCNKILNSADLVVKIKEMANKNYKRKKNDLIYTHSITLVDALNSEPVLFKTLDGRTLTVSMDEIIS